MISIYFNKHVLTDCIQPSWKIEANNILSQRNETMNKLNYILLNWNLQKCASNNQKLLFFIHPLFNLSWHPIEKAFCLSAQKHVQVKLTSTKIFSGNKRDACTIKMHAIVYWMQLT